jgi:KDO2-lipid IV(A) lauroyltransferase
MLQFLFYKIAQIVIHCVSRRQAYVFSRFLSDLHFEFSRKDRLAVIHNLEQITGHGDDVLQKARQVFRNFGRYLVDFFLMHKVDERFVRERVVVTRRDLLSQALAKGRGGIILTAHIGNWEMGAAVISKLGYRMTVIALPHKDRVVNDLFNRQRQKHGVQVVPTNFAIRRCVEALRKNELIALLGDRDFGTFGEPMMFLGRKTLIPKGAAFFSLKTGAPIIPSFLLPLQDGRYELIFSEPFFPPVGTARDNGAALELTERYAAVIEEQIRKDPAQWLMFREFGVEYEHLYPHPRT